MTDVFLSYSSRDRDRVRPIHDALVGLGFDVFWDVMVPAGSDWDRHIRGQLDRARCAVVIWSRHSVQSDNVRHEAMIAREAGKLIHLAIDDDVQAAQLPMGMLLTQVLKLIDWNGAADHPAWQQLPPQIEARAMPKWIERRVGELTLALRAEELRRSEADRRASLLEVEHQKEVDAQGVLRRERDRIAQESQEHERRAAEIALQLETARGELSSLTVAATEAEAVGAARQTLIESLESAGAELKAQNDGLAQAATAAQDAADGLRQQLATLQSEVAIQAAALAARESRTWEAAQTHEQQLSSFLLAFPDSVHAEAAAKQHDALRSLREADQQAWELALRADTAASYEAYLAAMPQGRRCVDAERRLKALRDEERDWGESSLSLEGITRFLDSRQETRFARQAVEARERLLAAAADDAGWESARRTDTLESFRKYLRDYPAARHRGEAEARIAHRKTSRLMWQIEQGVSYAFCTPACDRALLVSQFKTDGKNSITRVDRLARTLAQTSLGAQLGSSPGYLAVAAAPDLKSLYAIVEGERLAELDAESGAVLRDMGKYQNVGKLTLSPQGDLLLLQQTCLLDDKAPCLDVVDTQSGKKVQSWSNPGLGMLGRHRGEKRAAVAHARFCADNKTVVFVRGSGQTHRWDVLANTITQHLDVDEPDRLLGIQRESTPAHLKSFYRTPIYRAAPDGWSLAVYGSYPHRIGVIDLKLQKLTWVDEPEKEYVHYLIMSHDGKRLMTSEGDDRRRVRDATDGRVLAECESDGGPYHSFNVAATSADLCIGITATYRAVSFWDWSMTQ